MQTPYRNTKRAKSAKGGGFGYSDLAIIITHFDKYASDFMVKTLHQVTISKPHHALQNERRFKKERSDVLSIQSPSINEPCLIPIFLIYGKQTNLKYSSSSK